MSCSVVIPTSPSPAAFSSPETTTLNPSFRHGAATLRAPPPRAIGFGRDEFLPKSSSLRMNQVNPKRKRALVIEIPKENAKRSILAMGDELRSDGRREVVEEGLEFAVCCKRGKKKLQMEDRHLAMPCINGDSKTALFGVFDGHGGSKAAEFCSKSIGQFIVDEVENREDESSGAIEEVVRRAYLRTDEEFLKGDAKGGACCLTALLHNGNLVTSNAGDCRAVLCRGGQAEALTSDHKLSRPDERERVEQLGGFVHLQRGIWRLQGSLAVSRGIGDRFFKQWVTPEPETCTIKIDSESEFLIMASDGLWDKVSGQEAVDIARPFCIGDKNNTSPKSACRELTNLSLKRGSSDDISVMIILLQQFAPNQ
ncbi:Protein phosphatase 2C family protein [Rhynchospora pubera]|uniref:protein-serine/threonine phosphatase n=1 Tax=Rhynchospora pubera TaxID=906938 RepID=A0AAV8EXR0_9POAL|nr:Protein phosphatase 2C family protein [Rhynchospora pubera]